MKVDLEKRKFKKSDDFLRKYMNIYNFYDICIYQFYIIVYFFFVFL